MSKTMRADAIIHDMATHGTGTMARRHICPDCDDRTTIIMLGEEYPCPGCQEKMFEEQVRERQIDNSQFGAGA